MPAVIWHCHFDARSRIRWENQITRTHSRQRYLVCAFPCKKFGETLSNSETLFVKGCVSLTSVKQTDEMTVSRSSVLAVYCDRVTFVWRAGRCEAISTWGARCDDSDERIDGQWGKSTCTTQRSCKFNQFWLLAKPVIQLREMFDVSAEFAQLISMIGLHCVQKKHTLTFSFISVCENVKFYINIYIKFSGYVYIFIATDNVILTSCLGLHVWK